MKLRRAFHLVALPFEPLTELWGYRFLLSQLVLRDLKIRYKQAAMGFAWALLMPMLIVLSGAVVRLAISRVAGTPPDAHGIATVVVKSFPWAFFVGALGFANTSMITNASLLGKVYFPREVFPLSAVLAQTADSVVGFAVALVLLVFLGVHVTLQWLWVPILGMTPHPTATSSCSRRMRGPSPPVPAVR